MRLRLRLQSNLPQLATIKMDTATRLRVRARLEHLSREKHSVMKQGSGMTAPLDLLTRVRPHLAEAFSNAIRWICELHVLARGGDLCQGTALALVRCIRPLRSLPDV
jgi:hypothetical protein